jgi:pimeloyl-ACP methyl ester carboxylesterase
VEEERREVRAPDGRLVVFHVAGPEQSDLVVFHTGTPGTPHLEPGMVRACAERGLRIVCIARPGYSGSSRLPGRTYADNPADTALVAERLGAEKFFVHGHSGGGGPTLADAAFLPDRVRAVAVSATLAPRLLMGPSWWQGLEPVNGAELKAMEEGESALRACLEGRVEAMRGVTSGEDILDDPEFSEVYAPVDRACFTGEYLDWAVEMYPLVVSHGVDGWIDDDFGFFGDWGFDLARVKVPVKIWLGGQDRIVPAAHVEWLVNNVPGAELRMFPDEGHVSLLNNHFGDILDDLIEQGR